MRKVDLVAQSKAWARGDDVYSPMPELLLYMICEKFHCLPNSGGWYDQSPEVCESFLIIENAVNQSRKTEARRANKKNKMR